MKNLSNLVSANVLSDLDSELFEQYKKLFLSALTEEFGAWYFYLITKDNLVGSEYKQLHELFEENGKDELEDHAYWLMDRMGQLGMSMAMMAYPGNWPVNAEHEYITPEFDNDGNVNTANVIEKAIQSELDAIETYTNLVSFSGEIGDITSHEKFKEILSDEEEHLANLQNIYKNLLYN